MRPKGRACRACIIAEAWGQAGVATRYEAVPQTNHFTVLDALTDSESAMVSRLATLARG